MKTPPKRMPVVVVLVTGAALSLGAGSLLAGCGKDPQLTGNPPPPPEPEPKPVVTETSNPPGPDAGGPPGLPTDVKTGSMPVSTLPTWESVESGHPEGATNPPMPVLEVNEAGDVCHKAWFDPRMVPPEARQKGGIVRGADDAATGIPVQCPAEQVAEVLGRHAEVTAEGAAEGSD